MDAIAWVACFFILGVLGTLAMVLFFFWKVYVHGGIKHLKDAGKVVREVYDREWASKTMKGIPRPAAAGKKAGVDSGDDEPANE